MVSNHLTPNKDATSISVSSICNTRPSNTAHPRQSLFQRENELPRVGLEPTTLDTLLDRARPALIMLNFFCLLCYASVLNKEPIMLDKNSYYGYYLTNYIHAHQNSFVKMNLKFF